MLTRFRWLSGTHVGSRLLHIGMLLVGLFVLAAPWPRLVRAEGPRTAAEATGVASITGRVAAGTDHTCAIRTDGRLVCWGKDDKGQASPPPGIFTEVGAGYAHSCALRDDGTLACWGDNSKGQATPPKGTFRQVSAAWNHACAVSTDGCLQCWGDNSKGQAISPGGNYTQVSAGRLHIPDMNQGVKSPDCTDAPAPNQPTDARA